LSQNYANSFVFCDNTFSKIKNGRFQEAYSQGVFKNVKILEKKILREKNLYQIKLAFLRFRKFLFVLKKEIL